MILSFFLIFSLALSNARVTSRLLGSRVGDRICETANAAREVIDHRRPAGGPTFPSRARARLRASFFPPTGNRDALRKRRREHYRSYTRGQVTISFTRRARASARGYPLAEEERAAGEPSRGTLARPLFFIPTVRRRCRVRGHDVARCPCGAPAGDCYVRKKRPRAQKAWII